MLKADLSKATSTSVDDAVFRAHVRSLPNPAGGSAATAPVPNFSTVSAHVRDQFLASSLTGGISSSQSGGYALGVAGLDSVPERDTANLGCALHFGVLEQDSIACLQESCGTT